MTFMVIKYHKFKLHTYKKVRDKVHKELRTHTVQSDMFHVDEWKIIFNPYIVTFMEDTL